MQRSSGPPDRLPGTPDLLILKTLDPPGSSGRATALVWLALFALSFIAVDFANDHFDRISRGRQILAYGEHPFTDFRDPGYFLALYASAAAQALSGGGLLGEAILTSAAIAASGALTFWLASSASGSLLVGLAAATFTWIVPPRQYDYDKVFFYMAGLALCWRYVDSPTVGRVVAAGVITAIASMFRYDNGIFLSAACLAAIAFRRGPATPVLTDASWYLAAVLITLAPALVFVHLTAGLPEALRQITEYAVREGQRSELFGLPRLSDGWSAVAYVLAVVMAPLALIASLVSRHAGPWRAKIVAASLLVLCVDVFVLRDAVAARIGAAVPPAIVLAAWMIGRGRWSAGPAIPVAVGRQPGRRVVVFVAVVAIVVLAVAPGQLARAARAPVSVPRRLAAIASDLQSTELPSSYLPADGSLGGLAAYLRACTKPADRIVIAWFAPEVFFFAQRGFAGGMAVYLGDHWSSELDQRRTIQRLEVEQAPLAIVESASADTFRETYGLVANYLDREYQMAGATSFSNPQVAADAYQVLVRRSRADAPRDERWHAPCLALR